LAYWLAQLAGLPPGLELGEDRPHGTAAAAGDAAGDAAAAVPIALDAPAERRLDGFCRAHGLTRYMALLAATQLSPPRPGGGRDVAVGSPIAGRERCEVEGLIGCFVNTLVMRTHLAGEQTVGALLDAVRETVLGAHTHQEMPFELLIDRLAPRRDLAATPL